MERERERAEEGTWKFILPKVGRSLAVDDI